MPSLNIYFAHQRCDRHCFCFLNSRPYNRGALQKVWKTFHLQWGNLFNDEVLNLQFIEIVRRTWPDEFLITFLKKIIVQHLTYSLFRDMLIIRIDRDFFKHKTAKTDDKIRFFGVVMISLFKENSEQTIQITAFKVISVRRIDMTKGCEDYWWFDLMIYLTQLSFTLYI